MGLRDGQIFLHLGQPTLPPIIPIAPLSDLDAIPMANFQFTVKINGSIVALFQRISGISVQRNVEEIREGGFHPYVHELPREISYSHITLETGLSSSDFFYKWMMFGNETGSYLRLPVVLEQRYSEDLSQSPKTWYFDGAYPVRWSISDLSVENTTNIVIESLELSFNFFELEE